MQVGRGREIVCLYIVTCTFTGFYIDPTQRVSRVVISWYMGPGGGGYNTGSDNTFLTPWTTPLTTPSFLKVIIETNSEFTCGSPTIESYYGTYPTHLDATD